jgi:hypothetical protein
MRTGFAALIVVATLVLGRPFPQEGLAQTPAASLPPVHLQVTGNPAPVETMRLAIVTAARAAMPEAGTGRVTLTETAPPLQPLAEASTISLRAVLQFTVPGGKPLFRMMPAEITNAVVPWTDAQMLLVSNSPETLPFGKVLLNGALSTGETVRLLYHHSNGSATQRMSIGVNLSNPDRAPITLWLLGATGTAGTGSAGADELSIGHSAARAFLAQYWRRAGFMLQIPANTTLPLFLNELAPQGVASGLVQLRLIDGDHLNLEVFARMEGEMDPPPDSFAPNFDKVHQRGIFEHPSFTRPLTYTAGSASLMMDVGDDHDALRESQTGVPLAGNYGVVYTFLIDVNNPGPDPAPLALFFQALGGQTGGSVLIDDQIVDLPRVRSAEPQIIARIRLEPGKHRLLVVSTMPESGANYPIRLLLGPPTL